ncbi:DUF7738 domain-containing protein [Tenacibaculum amylolyticum]|uniref:DUF7738 domain-containing protein n=1 Tax=Tenacibaculum amylolyticum TaxID=104269 RepID=UPI0038949FA6
MKKSFILFLITFCALHFSFAQKDISIVYSPDKEVFLNKQKVNKETSLETVTSILGTPVIYKEYATGKVNYHYPKLGIAVHFVNNHLSFIGANFNWDGDKTFPKTQFKGTFKIDNVLFNKDAKESRLSEVKSYKIHCFIPGMCMSDPKQGNNAIIVGFKDQKLTQIGVEFKQ